jgi:hypothetical protein
MQTGQRIWKNCKRCKGTGVLHKSPTYEYPHTPPAPETYPPVDCVEIPCSTCAGLGIIPWGWLRDEKEETMPGQEA